MLLALSARMFEQRTGYELGLEELASLLAEIGYDGIELRRRQVNETSSPAELATIRDVLGRRGLRCANVTAAGLENAAAVDDATRLLGVALALNCGLIRVQLVREAEIPFAQQLADRAAERGLRVASPIHSGTLFANIEMARQTLAMIGRANYGVAFEASQLMFDDREHGQAAVEALGEHAFACFLETHKPAPADGEAPAAVMIGGRPWLPALPGDPGSADIPSVFRGLKAIGFDGPIVVTCARHPEVPSRELARMWHDYARQAMAAAGLTASS